ncbi:MAG TPA: tetratricopeptide repeat protein [Reyranella sp.]|nr:tetratricopeptide repeat protein [Reyranella sp.]
MSFVRPTMLLASLALASPVAAQSLEPFGQTSPDHLRRYTECMSLARKEPLRALPMAEKWAAEGGGLGARHCVAVSMYLAGRLADAAAQLEAIAADVDPERPGLRAELYAQAGQAWLGAGQTAKAAVAQSRALALKSDDADLWVDRALTYATTGEWPRAVSDFNHALALRKDDVEILVLRSAAWRSAGDMTQSLIDAQAALKIAPDNTDALLERGFTLLARGDTRAGEADFNKVLQLVPPDSEAARRAKIGLEGGQAMSSKLSPGGPAQTGQKKGAPR